MNYQNIKTTSVTITALPNKPVDKVVLEAINYATDMCLSTTLQIDNKSYLIEPAQLVELILAQYAPETIEGSPIVQNS